MITRKPKWTRHPYLKTYKDVSKLGTKFYYYKDNRWKRVIALDSLLKITPEHTTIRL